MGQHGRFGEQRLGGYAKAGRDTAALINSVCVDSVHRGGGAEIQNNKGFAIFGHSGDTGYSPVGTKALIAVRFHIGQGGINVYIHHQGCPVKVFDHGAGERIHDRGDDGGDDDILHLIRAPTKTMEILIGG